jgi:predicted nucleotidyltransferase
MYKRLNITLPDAVVTRADEFAQRERYTRSALIAAALEAFIGGQEPPAAEVAREAPAVYAPVARPAAAPAVAPATVYAPEAVGLNPAVRPIVATMIETCRRHGVTYAALVGSSTQPDPAVVPRDLDLLVRFEPESAERLKNYFGLIDDLKRATGKDVDLIELDAVRNARLRREFERTRVVLYEGP